MENRLNITRSSYYLNERVARLTRRQLSIPKKALIRTCKVKMLVVTDYGGSFGDDEGFGLGHFLRAFDEPLPFTSFEITKAHRRTDEDADIENFRFHEHDLSRYDVIWLFAVERPAYRPADQPVLTLTDAELRAVSEYMDQGGGIFATGDHEDLGVDMCGRIPRIRSMRRWFTAANPGPNGEPFAPAQTGLGRHDTLVDINPALAGVQGDQSDLTPQKIKLNYRYRTYHMGSVIRRQVKYPHPVLCSPDGVINVLPDHMHEGNCEVPTDLTKAFNFAGYAIQEYPMVGRARLTPEVIAEAVNHVTNSDFGVIAVLDGHQTDQIGRVLVDATWHHFFNINIAQFGQLKQAVDGGLIPTADQVRALEAYNLIQHYYRNIAYWLARRSTQACYRHRGWRWLLHHFDIRMSLVTHRDIPNLSEYYYTIGILAKNALGDLESECQSITYYIDIIPEFIPELLFKPRPLPDPLPFVDPEVYFSIALGAALHEANLVMVARNEMKDEELLKTLRTGAQAGLQVFLKEYEQHGRELKKRIR